MVADALHLLQPVADVEDRAALAGQALQRHEQMVRLLRRQHRGRLVHDDQLRLLQQAAHDLDALALADREVGDDRVRTERQAVVGRDASRSVDASPLRGLFGSASAMFSATVSASNSEKCWNTMPMPRSRAAAGLAMVTGLPFQRISSGGRLQRAVEDLDQRRLAGAVLAEERVDLARLDGEIDVVVGAQRRRNPW